jgi:hypothetical protein
MAENREQLPRQFASDCGCEPAWQKPKANGTCATCGGWLPGERPKPLPWSESPYGAVEVGYDTP